MMNDRGEIIAAVFESRDTLGLDLDNQVLEEILDVEMTLSDQTAIERALHNAIDDVIARGAGADGGDQ